MLIHLTITPNLWKIEMEPKERLDGRQKYQTEIPYFMEDLITQNKH